MKKSPPIRRNVLILVGAGYFVISVMFIAMAWSEGMTTEQAYDVVEGPLMALIGGSLAIAKDLIPFGDSELDFTEENEPAKTEKSQSSAISPSKD